MYKISFLIICLIAFHKSSAQTTPQTQLYVASQLQEDFNYYLTALKEAHPDLYAYTPKEEFDKQVQSIKSRVNKPINSYDFGLMIAELNQCVDRHTGIPLNIVCTEPSCDYQGKMETYQKEGGLLLPFIKIQGTKAYLNEEEIISINEKSMTQIMETLDLYYTKADSRKFSNWSKTINFTESGLSYLFFDLKSPFRFVTKASSGKIEKHIEKGWTVNDFEQYKQQSGYQTQPSVDCKFYLEDSIACIDWNDGFIEPEAFHAAIEPIFDQIEKNQTKHLFINITQNIGGYAHGNTLLGKIAHEAFDWEFKRGDRISEAYAKRFDIDSNYYKRFKGQTLYTKTVNRWHKVSKGFSGKVFIIQGPWTYSNGDDFARLAKASQRCILIGAPTGQRNRMITDHLRFKMPHTQLSFVCACKDFTYFDCDNDGLCPDIPFPIGIYKNSFSNDELSQMLRIWKQKNEPLTLNT